MAIGIKATLTQILSGSGNSAVTTTPESNYIFAGKAHGVSITLEDVPNTGLYYCVLDFSALSADKIAVLEPIVFFSDNGPVKVRTYDCTSYVGGTTLILNDANEIANDTAEGVFKYNLTSVTGATKIREYAMGSSGSRVSSRGGSSNSVNPLPIGAVKKIIEIDNNYTSGTVDFNIQILWYEVGV